MEVQSASGTSDEFVEVGVTMVALSPLLFNLVMNHLTDNNFALNLIYIYCSCF